MYGANVETGGENVLGVSRSANFQSVLQWRRRQTVKRHGALCRFAKLFCEVLPFTDDATAKRS